jgi:hypothetical protein
VIDQLREVIDLRSADDDQLREVIDQLREVIDLRPVDDDQLGDLIDQLRVTLDPRPDGADSRAVQSHGKEIDKRGSRVSK